MVIDTTKRLYHLNKEELKLPDDTESTIGKIIGNLLVNTRQRKGFDSLKAWTLAQKFYNDNSVEIDNADFDKLLQFMESIEESPLITGQILEYLKGLKEQKEEEKHPE